MSLALLVTGAGGLLATEVLELVRGERNAFARGLTTADLDVSDPFAVKDMVGTWARLLRSDSPDHQLVVVNATALGDADAAEADEAEAYGVGATGAALLAQACAAAGARLLHVSSADVFPGDRVDGPPYDVDDPTGPVGAYGRTLLAGEQAVTALHPADGYVVRAGWLLDGPGDGVVEAAVSAAASGDALALDATRRGSPTWSRDVAAGLLALARAEVPPGTYHCSGPGEASALEVGRALLGAMVADPSRAVPPSAPRPGAAPRPGYAVLSSRSWSEAALPVPGSWQDDLAARLSAGTTGG